MPQSEAEIIKKLINNLPISSDKKMRALNVLAEMPETALPAFKNKLLNLYTKLQENLKNITAESEKMQREIINPIFKKAEEKNKQIENQQSETIISQF